MLCERTMAVPAPAYGGWRIERLRDLRGFLRCQKVGRVDKSRSCAGRGMDEVSKDQHFLLEGAPSVC
jgi:hypothetical protein